MSTPKFLLAGYAQGAMYPASNLDLNAPKILKAGWNHVILGLFHIGRDFDIKQNQIVGDIYFNDTLIISKGNYVGDPLWPDVIRKYLGGASCLLSASFGGWRKFVYDFRALQKIWLANGNSYDGTNLKANFQVLKDVFPGIQFIDMDNEEIPVMSGGIDYFVDFCEMLIRDMGFGVTFCPFDTDDRDSFWIPALKALEANYPGRVPFWNLQCYSGGGSNNPQDWANALQGVVNTDHYLMASDWTRFWNNDPNYPSWQGNCPSDMQSHLSQFSGQSCIGGGFIWNFDQVFDFTEQDKQHSGSGCASGGGSLTDYVNAIKGALL